MRVGSFVFSTQQGLGILAKAFYDHGVVTDVMVIKHGRHADNLQWYPGAPVVNALQSVEATKSMRRFVADMDVMLFFETPFRWDVVPHCRKSVLMPMYECMPAALPFQPDLFINPSALDQRYYPSGMYIPVPVEYKHTPRYKAQVFVHNAGHGGLRGRNGTEEVLQAMRLVKSDAKLLIRCQDMNRTWPPYAELLDKAALVQGTVSYDELFLSGDVFLFPEKFNGLSLPMQEAYAAGMLVMGANRFPMNQWLPNEPLIPVSTWRTSKIGPPYNQFEEAIIQPRDIAQTIDAWYDKDITEYSQRGLEWAKAHSWNALKPRYMEALEKVCKS